MNIIRAFPFLAFVVIAYNGVLFFGNAPLATIVGHVALPSGAAWNVTAGEVLLVVALALLLVEIVASGTRMASGANHLLSLLLLLICVAEFLFVSQCGTGVFLLITVMTLIDTVAGYTIAVSNARRDLALQRPRI